MESLDEPLEGSGEERESQWAVPPQRYPVRIDEARIDADAAKVVRRLVRAGYEAYLVGGCVRDLLLGAAPKDFDVATSARPEAVRRLFRNSRIIGRRFRLVHVLFGAGKVIETATFRRNPSDEDNASDDLLIRDDNTFGEAHEDAARRDFTINALFYDLELGEVLDWCGGMRDIEERAVRTIGDPVIRFSEDPVRMLRAVRFSARLDVGIDPATYHAMVQCRAALSMAARPRLFDEVLKFLRAGAAHRSTWLAWETGLLDVLLPELSAFLYDSPPDRHRVWSVLDHLDLMSRAGQTIDEVVLFCCLLVEPMLEACDGRQDRLDACHEFLEPIVERLAVPRRIADAIRRIVAILPRLAAGANTKFVRTPLYPLAAQVLDCVRAGKPTATPLASAGLASGDEADPRLAVLPKPPRRKKKRSRKRRSETAAEPSASE
ncbi:MAG TPA: polynucleotide adenylyltransferase PcnB [Polyangiaceae bacterium]|nr:polynucleotide adenylyltransferase PcnB [Polyangiaceae bacterium]